MARIILVTGGGRSGKSSYALGLGEQHSGPRAFVATCPELDEEMRERIRKHQRERATGEWTTIEETTDLPNVLAGHGEHTVVLVDCLALWVNNLMYEAECNGGELHEADVQRICAEVLHACATRAGAVIFVTNEVGMGIIPDNALSRRYRDLLGRCNQVIARAADTVVFMVSGLPLILKEG